MEIPMAQIPVTLASTNAVQAAWWQVAMLAMWHLCK